MAVYARIEVEEQRIEIVQARHSEISLVFNPDLKTIEISNLSISLQVAYLGLATDNMNMLLSSFRNLSNGCKEVVKSMYRAANAFETDKKFVWDRTPIQKILPEFRECLKQAKLIYNDLENVCPHPQAEIEKIRDKISKITANIFSYISVENYKNHIRVSCALLKVSKLQHAMISVAALGCFITGIEHIIETINSFESIFNSYSDDTDGSYLTNMHSMISRVVVANASAMYFKLISFAIKEIVIFVGDKYTEEKRLEVFRRLSKIFLRRMKGSGDGPPGLCLSKDDDSTDEEEDTDIVEDKGDLDDKSEEHERQSKTMFEEKKENDEFDGIEDKRELDDIGERQSKTKTEEKKGNDEIEDKTDDKIDEGERQLKMEKKKNESPQKNT